MQISRPFWRRIQNSITAVLLALVIISLAEAGEDPDPISDPGHFDATIAVTPAASAGARIAVDAARVFPRDFVTQRVLIPANFGDFAGGPYKTDDPGWVMPAGQLLPGEVLRYRALNRLLFWDKNTQKWINQVPRGETVRLFGEVPTEVVLRNNPSELALYLQGTIWSVSGIAGPPEAAIQAADAGGSIHAHLDFCVQDSVGDCAQPGLGHSGTPTVGAYLIELQIFSSVAVNGQAKYRSSNPLFIVLNRGLTTPEFHQAVAARTTPPTLPNSRQLPGAGILIISQNRIW